MNQNTIVIAVIAAATLIATTACQKQTPQPPAQKPVEKTTDAKKPNDCGDEHDHEKLPVIELGTSKAGAFDVKATRAKKTFKGGCDAPVDVWVTGGAKVAAVRFWIGLEDAKASLKSKAEIEKAAEPDRYHSHVEIPDPIPAGSRLWIEVEAAGGAKSLCSFDLKL